MQKTSVNYKYLILAITALLYCLAYFHRVSPNVIAEYLFNEIHITATQLGTISSTYFIFYALMQPIVGILTDKIGAKKVILIFAGISIAGSIAFGFTEDFYSAAISRSIIGIGVSGVLVPSLKMLSEWFAPDKFARINGIYIAIGHSGALIGTTPLFYLSESYGWRNVFFIFAFIGLLLFLTALFFLANKPEASQKRIEKTEKISTLEGLKILAKMKNFWLLAIIFMLIFGAYMSFQGLWATKCIESFMNINSEIANTIVFYIPVGVIIGSLLVGFMSDNLFKSRTIPMKIGTISILICWILIIFTSSIIPVSVIKLVFFILGIGGGILLPLIFIMIKDSTDPQLLGTSLGFINPSYFIGIFGYQIITGYIIDMSKIGEEYTSQSYYVMMLFCLLTIILTVILSFFLDETYPKTTK